MTFEAPQLEACTTHWTYARPLMHNIFRGYAHHTTRSTHAPNLLCVYVRAHVDVLKRHGACATGSTAQHTEHQEQFVDLACMHDWRHLWVPGKSQRTRIKYRIPQVRRHVTHRTRQRYQQTTHRGTVTDTAHHRLRDAVMVRCLASVWQCVRACVACDTQHTDTHDTSDRIQVELEVQVVPIVQVRRVIIDS
jgi:hypothetical protein